MKKNFLPWGIRYISILLEDNEGAVVWTATVIYIPCSLAVRHIVRKKRTRSYK